MSLAIQNQHELKPRKIVESMEAILNGYIDRGRYYAFNSEHAAKAQATVVKINAVENDKYAFKIVRMLNEIKRLIQYLTVNSSRTLLPRLYDFLSGMFTALPIKIDEGRIEQLDSLIQSLLAKEVKNILEIVSLNELGEKHHHITIDSQTRISNSELESYTIIYKDFESKEAFLQQFEPEFKNALMPVFDSNNLLFKRTNNIFNCAKKYGLDLCSVEKTVSCDNKKSSNYAIIQENCQLKQIMVIGFDTPISIEGNSNVSDIYSLKYDQHNKKLEQEYYDQRRMHRTSKVPTLSP